MTRKICVLIALGSANSHVLMDVLRMQERGRTVYHGIMNLLYTIYQGLRKGLLSSAYANKPSAVGA